MTLHTKLLDFLTSLPGLPLGLEERKDFVRSAGYWHLAPHIQWDGAPRPFVDRLLGLLADQGRGDFLKFLDALPDALLTPLGAADSAALSAHRAEIGALLESDLRREFPSTVEFGSAPTFDQRGQQVASQLNVAGNYIYQAAAPAQPASARPAPPPPFQAPPPAAGHVPRPKELGQLKQHLLDAADQLLPNTVGLCGFGGAGKTTLARLFCAEQDVRRACADGILWVDVGKSPPDARAQLQDLVTALTGECNGCATLNGARSQFLAALAGRKVLLVLDDVWDEAHIRDFVMASPDCARLIITRNANTLPFEAIQVDLQVMQTADARRLLGAGLPPGNESRLDALADRLGNWPVLLNLANCSLRQRIVRQKTPPAKAIDAAARDLADKGVLAFDPSTPTLERDQAVAATMEASLELLSATERQCYGELAIFPPDVLIPLEQAGQLWQLTAGLASDQAEDLVSSRLDPLSLLEYDGNEGTLRLHDILRSYLRSYRRATLDDQATAALHLRLAEHWGERPAAGERYAWRWLAYHRAEAAMASPQPQRHRLAAEVVVLVDDESWQQAHEAALHDLPALQQALASALDAAVADDDPLGTALVVQAADALVHFRREHLRPEPIFELARKGDLSAARHRGELFTIDDHWRHALLLAIAWLAPADHETREQARQLCAEIQAVVGPEPALVDLVQWVRADLWDEAVPVFPFLVQPHEADELLIDQLLRRVGGWQYDRELIISRGLDPDVEDPDHPARSARRPTIGTTAGIYQGPPSGTGDGSSSEAHSTTRYLAELDGPYLVTYAAQDLAKGTDALTRYVSVYGNYSYPEYRYSTLWLLLGFVVRLPLADEAGRRWVRDALVRILSSALGGASVEFEQGVLIAVTALRAQGQDGDARKTLEEQAQELMKEALRLKSGRRDSDIWAHHKRLMLANAQAVGWLLGDAGLAAHVLQDALGLADSGFAGFQAPACLALAEAIRVCQPADQSGIKEALRWARKVAHNVQDPTFCARMTARVNAMEGIWWTGFNLQERARRLPDSSQLPEFAGLHRVKQKYTDRRPDALPLPGWAEEAATFAELERLYQRPLADFLRLNGGERALQEGDEVAVPDPGFAPHLAARLAAEVLALAGQAPLAPERLQLLRSLVPYAVASPTALDAVLTRLVLAEGRRSAPPDIEVAIALEKVLARRKLAKEQGSPGELIAGRSLDHLPS